MKLLALVFLLSAGCAPHVEQVTVTVQKYSCVDYGIRISTCDTFDECDSICRDLK